MKNWRAQHPARFYAGLTAVFTFLVYWGTRISDLTWFAFSGDGGELITAAATLGIPHPPGYPTYVLLGKLVSTLPLEPAAVRFHFFSSVCAAGAAGLTTAAGSRLLSETDPAGEPALALVPGLVFAFSPLVWDQARVAELYTLNLLLVAAFLWAMLGKRPSLLVGLLLGLSFTTHLTSLFLLPLALASTPFKQWPKLLLGALFGAAPFLLLPFLARQGSPVIWGDPTTLAGWFWLVSAKIYQPNQFALPAAALGPRVAGWSGTAVKQLALLGWPLIFYAGWRVRHGRLPWQKNWWLLAGTAVWYLVYALGYNTPDAIVLTLPAWLILSLCLTPALARWQPWPALLPLAALLLHLMSYNGANIHNIRQPAEQLLRLAPANAILITAGDPDIYSLWYFHHVEKQRPDVVIVDDLLFAFDWYRQNLGKVYPFLHGLEEDDLPHFTMSNRSQRPVCRVNLATEPNESTLVCSQDEN